MAHPADNVDWAILSVLQGEGPRTFQQMSWHLNLLDKLDLMLGLRRLLNEGKIVRDGDLYAVPAQRAVRNSSRARKNGFKEVVGLKGFVVVDYHGKFCGFGEDENEILEAVRAYDREHHAFEKPYRVWETKELVSQLPKHGALLNPAEKGARARGRRVPTTRK